MRCVPLGKRGRRECRMLAAPAASRTKVESTRVNHHRYAETLRHSLRNGFTAYTCSPRCTGLDSHRRPWTVHALDPSVGGSGPHAFAVRTGQARHTRPPRPPHSTPTFVTVAKRPSIRDGTKQEHKGVGGRSQGEFAPSPEEAGQESSTKYAFIPHLARRHRTYSRFRSRGNRIASSARRGRPDQASVRRPSSHEIRRVI
jgi:hypothetical protein